MKWPVKLNGRSHQVVKAKEKAYARGDNHTPNWWKQLATLNREISCSCRADYREWVQKRHWKQPFGNETRPQDRHLLFFCAWPAELYWIEDERRELGLCN